jgi:hypothetical protein
MVCSQGSDAPASRNPDTPESEDNDQIVGGCLDLRRSALRSVWKGLCAVLIEVQGLPIHCSLLLSDRSAVHLATALGSCVGRLQGVQP